MGDLVAFYRHARAQHLGRRRRRRRRCCIIIGLVAHDKSTRELSHDRDGEISLKYTRARSLTQKDNAPVSAAAIMHFFTGRGRPKTRVLGYYPSARVLLLLSLLGSIPPPCARGLVKVDDSVFFGRRLTDGVVLISSKVVVNAA